MTTSHNSATTITIEATVNAPVEKVWACWTEPAHITQWSFASDDWHAPRAENNPVTGGSFLTRMEAKDGSFGFDFEGTYDLVRPNEQLNYTIADGRKVSVTFTPQGDGSTHIIETFEAENVHPAEQQEAGWQAFLNNFKAYAEGVAKG